MLLSKLPARASVMHMQWYAHVFNAMFADRTVSPGGSNTSPNEERKTPFETARGTILLNLSRALESTNKTPSDWNERVLKFYEHKEREFLDPFRISSS